MQKSVAAVQVERVGQAQAVHDPGQGCDTHRRRQLAIAGHRPLQVLAPLPACHSANSFPPVADSLGSFKSLPFLYLRLCPE